MALAASGHSAAVHTALQDEPGPVLVVASTGPSNRAALGEANEGGDRGTDTFDRLRSSVNFFYIDARR